ncbi:MAG: hypothetical protein HXM82_01700 [Neisseria sp.]|nr:hypothetical protein [Neisseria sp.]
MRLRFEPGVCAADRIGWWRKIYERKNYRYIRNGGNFMNVAFRVVSAVADSAGSSEIG